MRYAKSAAAVLATLLTGIVGAMTDSQITPSEWINVAILGAGAAGVFTAPNVPGSQYVKAFLAIITAVLVLLVSFIGDGVLSQPEILQLIVAALGALGVYAIPNQGDALAQLTAQNASITQ